MTVQTNPTQKRQKLNVPSDQSSAAIVHGTDENELSRGGGQFAGSVLPGEKDNSDLTVTTCYPFNFFGSAPDRYILIADLVSSE